MTMCDVVGKGAVSKKNGLVSQTSAIGVPGFTYKE